MLLAKSSYIIGEGTVTVSLLTRKEKSIMVFVLDTNKNPLDSCHPARARKLLRTSKAKIFKKYPFTIILNKRVKEINKHQYRLKIDYGSRCTFYKVL